MNSERIYFELHCPKCGAIDSCNLAAMTSRLQAGGKLRRAENPEVTLIAEIAKSAGPSWPCPACKNVGLDVRLADDDSGDWTVGKQCAACKAPISAERLEIFPGAALCAACQQNADAAGGEPAEREFCPHCGGLMQVRHSTSRGIARYVSKCSDCGR